MRIYKIASVILSLLLIGIFSYIYSPSTQPGEIKLIKKDESPARIKPSEIGGMKERSGDSTIYRDLLSGGKKTLKINLKTGGSDENTEPNLEIPTKDLIDIVIEEDEREREVDFSSESGFRIIKIESPPRKAKTSQGGKKTSRDVGGCKVNLGSFKSQSAALKESGYIKSKYAKILGKEISVETWKSGEGDSVYYSLTAGNYGSRARAEKICRELVSLGQTCSVEGE